MLYNYITIYIFICLLFQYYFPSRALNVFPDFSYLFAFSGPGTLSNRSGSVKNTK